MMSDPSCSSSTAWSECCYAVEIEENVRVRDLGGFMNKLGRGLLIAIPVAGMFFLLNVPQ